jgi:hypothetical protein
MKFPSAGETQPDGVVDRFRERLMLKSNLPQAGTDTKLKYYKKQ